MRMVRSRKLVVLVAAALAIGVVMVATPASAITNWTNVWNNHIKPKADQRYVKKSAIKTIQGNYAAGLQAGNIGDDGWDSISFGFELSSAPEEHFLTAGSASTAQCPGTAVNPLAAPGHLCVYESVSSRTAAASCSSRGTTGFDEPGEQVGRRRLADPRGGRQRLQLRHVGSHGPERHLALARRS